MDFVVVGFGLGALCILIGVAIYDWGPHLRRISSSHEEASPQRDPVIVWLDGCRAAGIVLALAGSFLWLVTLVPFLARASDEVGSLLLLIAVAITGIAAVVIGGPFVWRRAHPADPIGFIELAHRIRADAQERRLTAREARRQALARSTELPMRTNVKATVDDPSSEAQIAAPEPIDSDGAESAAPDPPPATEVEETVARDLTTDLPAAEETPTDAEPASDEESPAVASTNAPEPDEPVLESPEATASAESTSPSDPDPDRAPPVVAATPSSRMP